MGEIRDHKTNISIRHSEIVPDGQQYKVIIRLEQWEQKAINELMGKSEKSSPGLLTLKVADEREAVNIINSLKQVKIALEKKIFGEEG